MKRFIIVAFVALLMLVSCSTTSSNECGEDSGQEKIPDKGVALSEKTIPAQSGLSQGVEYELYGKYDTGTMGLCDVTARLYYDGYYEIEMNLLNVYFTIASYGTWSYDTDSDSFTIEDMDTGHSFSSVKEGDSYVLTYEFRGEKNTVSNSFEEKKAVSKLNVNPNPEGGIGHEPLEEEVEEVYLVTTAKGFNVKQDENGANYYEDDGFELRLYSDGSSKVFIGQANREVPMSTWSFKNGNLVINDAEGEVPYVLEDGEYKFMATVVMYETMFIPRYYVLPAEGLKDPDAATAPVSIERYEISDRYSNWTADQWNELYAENDMPSYREEYTAMNLPAVEMDSLFESITPMELFAKPADADHGTIEEFFYKTFIYDYYENNGIPEDEWKRIEKSCYVYLPAGYNPSEKYDVYYLMHGATGNAGNWFSMNCDGTGSELGTGDFVVMVDNMIAKGLIKPAIFVSCTTNTDISSLSKKIRNSFSTSNETNNFGKELALDIIPQLESHYSTYLEGTTVEDLAASRNHRALAGLSMGAYVTWVSIPDCLDRIGFFAPLSNGSVEGETTYESLSAGALNLIEKNDNNPDFTFLFAQCGYKDHCYARQQVTFDVLYSNLAETGKLLYGENCYCFVPENGTHTVKYFINGVYNSLKVFFK